MAGVVNNTDMRAQKIDSTSPFKNGIIALLPLAVIYFLWCLVSFSVLNLGRILVKDEDLLRIVDPVSVVFFIALASTVTTVFAVHQEHHLKHVRGLRHFLLLLTVAVGTGLFIFVRKTGNTNSIIFIIGSANLLVFANLIGSWIVTPLKRPAELVLVCVVMSLADLFSLMGGPTKEIVKSIDTYYKGAMKGLPPAGDFLLIKIAVPGFDKVMPVFGVADWIIVAFLSAAAVKFGINDNLAGRSLGGMVRNGRLSFYLPVAVLGLTVTVFLVRILGVFLPALPVIALFFLTYILVRYPKARMLKRSDWVLLILFSCVMVGLFAVFYNTLS